MNYWLLKTEPSDISIDDIQSVENGYMPWNGIRNYQARNLIRDQIKKNDLLLIYHSSCKQVGIVGIAKVAREAYPDPEQFNPESRYFDPKSSIDNFRWFCIDISFVEKFENIVPLIDIKNASSLSEMVLVKQGRLSVQPVTQNEWENICRMSKVLK